MTTDNDAGADRQAQGRTAAAAPRGWDAHEVWDERVRTPRAPGTAALPATAAPEPGWDPKRVWHERVRPAEKTPT